MITLNNCPVNVLPLQVEMHKFAYGSQFNKIVMVYYKFQSANDIRIFNRNVVCRERELAIDKFYYSIAYTEPLAQNFKLTQNRELS